ncbi:TIR domain-containing protein (plasmid) [Pedobacter sp. BS3]|uniref:toll/interleukin-1 receptor domain-containing protein n=1 Tax=Pedobacter sp. BS3 TaxID=2567937 RepID=UPI0011ED4AFA|nr:toll/interleukin-1 receptor domain-containing protein [Pedobacter sp. BS3]TZF85819.1 TIR domain-containing protein [Pedobacter sp. BS3]
MKVFISWSGDRSKRVAELLDGWIQCVLQAVNPWMSSKDIDRGALWFTEITDQLANTSIGIVCLTKENKNKPWILFESGALAKGLTSNRVCTFLIDLAPTDLENPLAQFNHTFPTRDSVWELVRTINLSLKENALKESILSKVFDTYWSQFEIDFQEIIVSTPETEVVTKRKDNDIMLDVLSTVRILDKRLRNIESNNERQIIFSENEIIRREPERLNLGELKMQIQNYLEQELPEELILSILSEKGTYPRSIIRREMERGKSLIESRKDK